VLSLNEDTTLTGSVLTGTSSVDGPVSVTGFSVAGNATAFSPGQTATINGVGTLLINANGSHTFTPVANYFGPVPVVTYTVTDGLGPNVTSTLTLTVLPVNDDFTDANETVSVNQGTTLADSVLTGTSSVDGPVSVTGFSVAGNATAFNAGQTATINGVGTLLINANGNYTFTPAANYFGPVPVVTYTVTDGLGPNDTSNLSITVNPGPASLGDRVWEDLNGNGIQDTGEAGVAGVTVTLTGGGADGIINGIGDTTTTTTTNANGLYAFTGLTSGQQYQVGFNLPAGYQFTRRDTGLDTADSDADTTTGKTLIVTLAAGENNTTIDAGIYRPVSLGDRAWIDRNANGIQDAGEAGLAGVTVRLLDGGGNPVLVGGNPVTTTTNASGNYLFNGLAPGQYKAQFTAPQGYVFTTPDVGANDGVDSDANILTGITQTVTLTSGQSNLTLDVGLTRSIGGINLGGLTDYLFFFANGSRDANWQGATKGFVGDVAVNGALARERTSGGVPYAGTIYTNDSSLGAWQGIINQNPSQATAVTGETARINNLTTDLNNAFTQINSLSATLTQTINGTTYNFTNISSSALNGLNTQDSINKTYVINVTSGFQVSSKINIRGDAGDVFVLRWDTNANPTDGYQGQVKLQSGGAIVPLGGLKTSNFIHVAGDINASGGGSNPASPFPQGPRLNEGAGNLITGGANFSGGGFFSGYWLTTGAPANGSTSSLSNGIFVGGWYTLSNQFSMTSGTSGIYISPNAGSLSSGLR
jgi:hypothetical protein